ncbi:MAG TPA: hypothetical protein DCQ64_23030 [Candidatus Rokubacteria bacterium]|nr:hypothetical protein [Candidatus Rokubacteria bacterium]
MRHKFGHLGGTLNTFQCRGCGAPLNATTERRNCLRREGVVRAYRHIRQTLGLSMRAAWLTIYGY